MQNPGIVILGVFAVGAVFVLIPIALTSLAEHRRPRHVRCPEKGSAATVCLDPGRAARGALFGLTTLSVTDCSFWPEKKGCGEDCVKEAGPGTVAS